MGQEWKKFDKISFGRKGFIAEIRSYNGDCIETMKQLDDASVDLIITDLPYNLGNFMENRDINLVEIRENFFGAAAWDDLDFDDSQKSMDNFFMESARVLKKGGSIFVTKRINHTNLCPWVGWNLNIIRLSLLVL